MTTARHARRRLVTACLAASAAATAAERGVLEHHNDAARSGVYTMPDLSHRRAAALHRDTGFDGSVEGAVYAQPLYWENGNGRAFVVVATEANMVEALDAKTGRFVPSAENQRGALAVFDGRRTRMDGIARYQTPIAAAGRIYVAGRGRVYAFRW